MSLQGHPLASWSLTGTQMPWPCSWACLGPGTPLLVLQDTGPPPHPMLLLAQGHRGADVVLLSCPVLTQVVRGEHSMVQPPSHEKKPTPLHTSRTDLKNAPQGKAATGGARRGARVVRMAQGSQSCKAVGGRGSFWGRGHSGPRGLHGTVTMPGATECVCGGLGRTTLTRLAHKARGRRCASAAHSEQANSLSPARLLYLLAQGLPQSCTPSASCSISRQGL